MTTKKLRLIPKAIIYSLLILFSLTECSRDNSSKTMGSLLSLYNGQTGTATISLKPESSLIVKKDNILSDLLKTIAPSDQDITISAYDISFKHDLYPYPVVELKDLPGTLTTTEHVWLQAGTWTVTVQAKNAKMHHIGIGTASIVINPGRITTGTVSVKNISGNAPVQLLIDLSEKALASPKVMGKLVKRNASGTIISSIDMDFTINSSKSYGTYTGDVPAGFYELFMEVQDLYSGTYIPLTSFHDTAALYAGIPLAYDYYLTTIPGAGFVIKDGTDRPVVIAMEGIQDELVYSDTMEVIAYPTNIIPELINKIEWKMDNVLIEGENSSTIIIEGSELTTGVHELQVLMHKGASVHVKKGEFTVNSVPLTVSLTAIPLEIEEGQGITVTAETSIAVDSYVWYLDGKLISGETGQSITLNNKEQALTPGDHTLEARVKKGTITRSATRAFKVLPLTITISLTGLPSEITEGQETTVTAETSIAVDSYSWYLDGKLISGEGGQSIILNKVQALAAGDHTLEVRVKKGSIVRSATRAFKIIPLDLTVSLSGLPSEINEGQEITVTAETSMAVDSYEWYLNGNVISGETGQSIILNKVQALTPGNYGLRVRVKIGIVVRSVNMMFKVLPLTIELNLSKETINLWGTLTGTVTTSFPVDRYEWYLNGVLISGETASTITVGSDLEVGTYLLMVKAMYNTITRSDSSQFTVNPYPFPMHNILGSGTYHSLYVQPDGTVLAWGDNDNGQLGDGTKTRRLTPVQVQNLTNVLSAAGGNDHSAALKSDGTVWTWGYNYYGQLGDGTNSSKTLPVQVTGISDVVGISAGYLHTMSLKSDGTVWAWGRNYYGPLGNGTTNDSSVPVQVQNLTGVIKIAARGYHSLALCSDGILWVWGDNSSGQLGNGSTTKRTLPIKVISVSSVTAIAAGHNYSLALCSDGTVWAWGANNYGQLGNGKTTRSLVPVQVKNLTDIVSIAAGDGNCIALKSDGTVWIWGANFYDNTGTGMTVINLTPVQVQEISNAISISAGYYHFMLLKNDESIWTWGFNGYGQLGDNTTINRLIPQQIR